MPSTIPLSHEFGPKLLENFHHFENLQKLLEPTISQWRGCGSYMMNGQTLNYESSMYGKQCNLYDRAKSATHALEIGVHGGHSLMIMLLANPDLVITCIDICVWSHTEKCVEYLNGAFGNRVTLHKGATLDVLPSILAQQENWDLAHIDGTHEIDVIRQEFSMVKTRLVKDAIVIFDDYSTPGLAHEIHNVWSASLGVIDIPNCLWPHCVTRYLQ